MKLILTMTVNSPEDIRRALRYFSKECRKMKDLPASIEHLGYIAETNDMFSLIIIEDDEQTTDHSQLEEP